MKGDRRGGERSDPVRERTEIQGSRYPPGKDSKSLSYIQRQSWLGGENERSCQRQFEAVTEAGAEKVKLRDPVRDSRRQRTRTQKQRSRDRETEVQPETVLGRDPARIPETSDRKTRLTSLRKTQRQSQEKRDLNRS